MATTTPSNTLPRSVIAPGGSLAERLAAFKLRGDRYCKEGLDRDEAASFVATAVQPMHRERRVLDIGTGRGLLAIALARLGFEAVSVDVANEDRDLAALLAQEAGVQDRIRFLCADAAALPFPDGGFGAVAMMDVLHHLHQPLPIFNEMVRVVRGGGRIVVAEFSEDGFRLVDRLHREGGCEHARTTTTLDLARVELEHRGCRHTESLSGHLHEAFVVTTG